MAGKWVWKCAWSSPLRVRDRGWCHVPHVAGCDSTACRKLLCCCATSRMLGCGSGGAAFGGGGFVWVWFEPYLRFFMCSACTYILRTVRGIMRPAASAFVWLYHHCTVVLCVLSSWSACCCLSVRMAWPVALVSGAMWPREAYFQQEVVMCRCRRPVLAMCLLLRATWFAVRCMLARQAARAGYSRASWQLVDLYHARCVCITCSGTGYSVLQEC